MAHFLLRDPDSPNLVSRLEKQGRGKFFVKPTSKNEGLTPITGRATVDIMGKKAYISLVHKINEGEDPEPSVPKWSYFINLYSGYDPTQTPPSLTPVSESVAKSFQSCYIFANAGKTTYSGSVSNVYTYTRIGLGYNFTVSNPARSSVETDSIYNNEYDHDYDYMNIGEFRMFYKPPTIDPVTGDPIIPTDDLTPTSNRERLPCNVAIADTPNWITNVRLRFWIITYPINNPSAWSRTTYDDWASFRAAWETVRANTIDYSDVNFGVTILGRVNTNVSTEAKNFTPLVIQEIAGDSSKIWGAKVLTLYIGQMAGYKRIRLYYKKAESSEVTVPGSGGVYPVTAQSPGMAQVSNVYHKLWFNGEPCNVFDDEQGDPIITVAFHIGTSEGKITGKGVSNDRNQSYRTLDYTDDSKDRTEYYYIGHPFFLGFVEETNLYKEQIGINLFDNRNARDFWHSLYFTGVDDKCSYDPEWHNVGETPHLYQGSNPLSIANVGYTILFPWAVKSGNSWKSLYEIPTAYSNEGLTENSHRILAIDWIAKAAGDPVLGYDNVKSTSDMRYGGSVSIESGLEAGGGVMGRDKSNGEGWKYNPNAVPDGAGANRLHNYLEYVAQQWDNNITAFGSPADLRNVKEILFVPMFITSRKMCPNDPINASNINHMCYGSSLLPDIYKSHEGYAPLIGIFPPKITGWY